MSGAWFGPALKIMPRECIVAPIAGRPGRPGYPVAGRPGRPGYRPRAGYPGCYYGYRVYGAAGAVGGAALGAAA